MFCVKKKLNAIMAYSRKAYLKDVVEEERAVRYPGFRLSDLIELQPRPFYLIEPKDITSRSTFSIIESAGLLFSG